MTDALAKSARNAAWSSRPTLSTQDILASDTRPVSPLLREERNDFVGGESPKVQDYLSREVYLDEVEKIWKRVWQLACRAEDILNVGDHILFEIADVSLIIIRSGPTEVKAFYNSCLHRGRQLRECGGTVPNLRCAFHGFAWGLDGRLKSVPARWDFPDLAEGDYRLPEARVAQWGGFIFVNLDPDAVSLEEYLGDLPEHLQGWRFERRFKAAHVGKVLRANWKVAVEAFLENLHGITTHPQVLPFLYDQGVQYDARRDRPHYSRMIGPMGVTSPYLASRQMSEQQILDSMTMFFGPEHHELPAGATARQHAAEMMRSMILEGFGWDVSTSSDSEILDLIVYFLFPNVDLFGGFTGPLHRFRPWENDHEQTLWEIMVLLPVPDGGPVPPGAPLRILTENEGFADAAELGGLGPFFQQDESNIEWVQRGLHTSQSKRVTLCEYQESLIRHFYHTRQRYLDDDIC